LTDCLSKLIHFTGNQAVKLQSFALLCWAVTVSHASFRSTEHLKPKLRAVMKNNSPFLLSTLPIFTRALITFVRANNPTYSFISLLCIQQYYRLSPFVNLVVALSLSYQG
jgi:hypothetical protein